MSQTLASMPAASALDGTELFYVNQAGADRKVSLSAIQAASSTAIVLTAGANSISFSSADTDAARGAALESALAAIENLGYINGYDGFCLQTELLLHSNGKYYVVATYGGEHSLTGDVSPISTGYDHFIGWTLGVVFSIDPSANYAVAVVHRFARAAETWNPHAPLVEGAAGLMYGAGYTGPTGRTGGSIFSLTTGGTYTNLRNQALTDGVKISGQMLWLGSALYGTASSGGANGDTDSVGCIWKYIPGSTYSVLKDFDFDTAISGSNTTGSEPKAGLVTDGTDLFGVCQRFGALYTFTAIADVTGQISIAGHGMTIGDSFVWASVSAGNKVVAGDGMEYYVKSVVDANTITASLASGGPLFAPVGTATSGTIATGDGTVFKITTAGVFTRLYTFRNGTNGRWPVGIEIDVTPTPDRLIVTCRKGGANDLGTILTIGTDASSPTLRNSFDGTNGAHPASGMVKAGTHYFGVSAEGGLYNLGVVYKLTSDTLLFSVLAHLDDLHGAEGWAKPTYNGSNTIVFPTLRGGAYNGGAICSIATNASAGTAPPTIRYSAPAGSANAFLNVPKATYSNLNPRVMPIDRFVIEGNGSIFKAADNSSELNVSMGASGVRNMIWCTKNRLAPCNEIQFRNIIFDCNVTNQTAGNVSCFGALIIYGTNCRIEGLRVRDWGGFASALNQGYILWINTAGAWDRYLFANHYSQGANRNNHAINCVGESCYPGTKGSTSFLRIGGDNTTNASAYTDGYGLESSIVNCHVENCDFVQGYFWAFNLQGTMHGLCDQCTARNLGPVSFGFGTNNWSTLQCRVTALRTKNVLVGIGISSSNQPGCLKSDVQISGCHLDANDRAIEITATPARLKITDNHLSGANYSLVIFGTGTNPAVEFNDNFVSGAIVTGGIIFHRKGNKDYSGNTLEKLYKVADETRNFVAGVSSDATLQFPVSPGTRYRFRALLLWKNDATSVMRFQLNGPSVVHGGYHGHGQNYLDSWTYVSDGITNDFGAPISLTDTSAGTTVSSLIVTGTFVPTVTGTFALAWGAATAANCKVYRGSFLEMETL